jgi:hypothetical protein
MTAASAIRLGLIALGLVLAPLGALAQTLPEPKTPVSPLVEPTLPADVEFARNIAHIRADLLIADALVKERDWVDARPHVNLPREEIYGVIRDELRTYKTPPFDGALRELARAVAARNIKNYDRALKKVQAAFAAADVGLQARQKDWPRFTLAVAAAILGDAADEYDDAVTNGRIVHAVGYQSARGIVSEAARMVENVATELVARDAETLHGVRGNMIRLKDAFASVAAPKEPRADVDTVRQLVAQTGALMRAVK